MQRYVRDMPTAIDSNVITALGAGTHVKVLGRHTTPLSKNDSVVWLQVELKK